MIHLGPNDLWSARTDLIEKDLTQKKKDLKEIKKGSSLFWMGNAGIEWITKMVADAPIPQNRKNAAAPEGTPPRRF